MTATMAREPVDHRADRSSGRWRVLAIAVILLIIVDTGFGLLAPRLDSRQGTVDELRAMGEALAAADGQTAFLIGHQALDSQLDAEALQVELTASTASSWTAELAPLEGGVAVWSAAYDQHIARSGARPSVVVIGFIGDGVDDQNRIDWATIGRLHTSWDSLGDRIDQAPDTNAKLFVTAARASALLGHRQWFFTTLGNHVPGFSRVPRTEPSDWTGDPTHQLLTQFVSRVVDDGAEVAVVALPTRRPSPLPPDLVESVDDAGGVFVDLRLESLLTEESFTTSSNLTADGIRTTTARLAASLGRLSP